MISKLGEDSPLLEYMIPDFGVGCRRPTPGNGYLEALGKENVRVVTDHIAEIVPEGIKTTTGEVIKVDMFICATGFDISFCPRYPVIGNNGLSLAEAWKDKPAAYMSVAVPGFSNHFSESLLNHLRNLLTVVVYLGPNAPIGHGSVLPIIEHATKYIMRMLHKCQMQDIRKVTPTQAATDDFSEHIDIFMTRTVWSTGCRSWFKNGKVDGPVVALHPGSRIHWFHMLQEPRYEDYEWERTGRNRFSFLGNGFSVKEDTKRDTTWYFNNPDEGFESLQY